MPSFSPHHGKTQNQQSHTAAAAQEPMIQAVANQQTKPKGRQTAAPEILLPAHENTPLGQSMVACAEICQKPGMLLHPGFHYFAATLAFFLK